MEVQSLRIEFGVQTSGGLDSSAFILLEQGDWDPFEGALTMVNVANSLANAIYDQNYDTGSPCSSYYGEPCVTSLFAYPSDSSLVFNVYTTKGSLKSINKTFEEFGELINVRFDEDVNLKYPVYSGFTYSWDGEVYDDDGSIVSAPSVKLSGGKAVVSSAVAGTLLVSYTVVKYEYELSIDPPDDDSDDWDAVVYAIFNGGVVWLEIIVPDSAKSSTGECSSRSGDSDSDDDDDDDPNKPIDSDRITDRDYCTDEILYDHFTGL